MLVGFLMLWFFAAVIFPVINRAACETLDIAKLANFHPFEGGTISYSFGFFVAGYVLKEIAILKRWLVIAIVFWMCLVLTPVNTYLRMTYPDSSMFFLFVFIGKYITPIVAHPATLAVIAFLALRSLGDSPSVSSSWFGRLVISLAPLTFGIFLCHHLFLVPTMGILDKTIGLGSTKSWLLVLCAIPVLTVLIYSAAAVLIYLIRRSRYLKPVLAP